jgi:hypothetical protein
MKGRKEERKKEKSKSKGRKDEKGRKKEKINQNACNSNSMFIPIQGVSV